MSTQIISAAKKVTAALNRLRWFIAVASIVAALPIVLLVMYDGVMEGERRLTSVLGNEGLLRSRRMVVDVLLAGVTIHIIGVTVLFAWLYYIRRINPHDPSGDMNRQ